MTYGNHMPPNMPDVPVQFVCRECGGLNKHLRSCSLSQEDMCPECRCAPGMPHADGCTEV